MSSFMVLILLVLGAGFVGYFILYGLCKLIETMMKKSDGFLRTAMILVTMTATVWVCAQYKHADEILYDVKVRLISSPNHNYSEGQFDWK